MSFTKCVALLIISFIFCIFVTKFALTEEVASQIDHWNDVVKYGTSVAQQELIDTIIKKKEPDSYPILLTIIKNEDNVKTIKKCLIACLTVNYVDAGDTILEQLNKYDNKQEYELLSHAIRTLGKLNCQKAVDVIAGYIDSMRDRIKHSAIEAIGDLKAIEHLSKLHELFEQTKDNDIKHILIVSIGKIASPSSIEFLLDVIQNNSHGNFLTNTAINALTNFDLNNEKVKKSLLDNYSNIGHKNKSAYFKILIKINDPVANKIMLKALKDDDVSIRNQSIISLREKIITSVVPQLKYMALYDKNRSVKCSAFATLLKYGGDEIDTLIKEKLFGKNKDPFYQLAFLHNCSLYDKKKVPAILLKLYTEETLTTAKHKMLKSTAQLNFELTFDLFKHVLKKKSTSSKDGFNKLEVLKIIRKVNKSNVKVLFEIALNDESKFIRAKAVYYSSFSPINDIITLVKGTVKSEQNFDVLLEYTRYFYKIKEQDMLKSIKSKIITSNIYSTGQKLQYKKFLEQLKYLH